MIVLAIVALLAIPLIAAVLGRAATDEDPNETGDPEHDPNVEPRESPDEDGESGSEGSGSERGRG